MIVTEHDFWNRDKLERMVLKVKAINFPSIDKNERKEMLDLERVDRKPLF